MECNRAQNLIDAHLDSELDAVHSGELDAHLRDCPACTSLLNRRRALQQALRANLPYFPAPKNLRRTLEESTRPTRYLSPFKLAIAAALLIAVGGLTVYSIDRIQPAPQISTSLLADAIESSHMRSLLPDHLLDVISTDKHTVKPWFAGKIPFTPPVHDFVSEGFPLIGGRLDVINHHPVAALIYHRNKHTLNLYIWPTTDSDTLAQISISLTTPRGFHLIHWTDQSNTYWLASDLEPTELATFADLFQKANMSQPQLPAK